MSCDRRRWCARIAALLVLPLAGGCRLPSAFQPLVRLGITDWPGYEYFYLAQEWGLSEAQGLRLQVNQHSSLKDQRFSYEQGDVDALATTVSEALAICQEMPTRCPRLVLVLDESIGGDQLIAHRRIPDLAGLRGQQVGLERSVLGEYLLLRALETVGLDLGDVDLVYAGPRALIDQMQAQELAAVVTYSPYSASLLNHPTHQILFSSSQLPRDVVDVLAVSPDFAQRHPQQVAALVNTWWVARQQARRRPAEAQALMARREGIPVEDFRRSEAMLRYVDGGQQHVWLKPGGWLQTTVKRMAQRLQAAGRLPRAMPLPQVTSRWAGGRSAP